MLSSTKEKYGNPNYASKNECAIRKDFYDHFKNCPIPDQQILENLGLFMSSKNLARILLMDHLYKISMSVHGSIFEFGTRWGQNVALFSALRGIYEPFNRHRKIVGFDTFTGFPKIDSRDNNWCQGNLAVTPDYYQYLDKIMHFKEAENPMSHIKKYELIAGDATETIHTYLLHNAETIISLAYFDFDIYLPTKECLEAIKPRLTKGSVIAFDELNDPDSPGETVALMEVFGLNSLRIQRFPYASRASYCIID